jgi:hypothetical protein
VLSVEPVVSSSLSSLPSSLSSPLPLRASSPCGEPRRDPYPRDSYPPVRPCPAAAAPGPRRGPCSPSHGSPRPLARPLLARRRDPPAPHLPSPGGASPARPLPLARCPRRGSCPWRVALPARSPCPTRCPWRDPLPLRSPLPRRGPPLCRPRLGVARRGPGTMHP